jgi:hypothetical protein
LEKLKICLNECPKVEGGQGAQNDRFWIVQAVAASLKF